VKASSACGSRTSAESRTATGERVAAGEVHQRGEDRPAVFSCPADDVEVLAEQVDETPPGAVVGVERVVGVGGVAHRGCSLSTCARACVRAASAP
jgi:hypothetical protein